MFNFLEDQELNKNSLHLKRIEDWMEYLYNRIGKCKVKLIGTHVKEEKNKKKAEEILNLLKKHLIKLKEKNEGEYPEIHSILPIDSIKRIGVDQLIQQIISGKIKYFDEISHFMV